MRATANDVDIPDFLETTGATILVLATVCAIALWCSSLFRRSIHSTASAYGFVLVLCVVTAIVFAILASRLDVLTMSDPPAYVQTPLLFNPFYALLALTVDERRNFSYPISSCLLTLGILGLAAGLTMRRMQRSGEQV